MSCLALALERGYILDVSEEKITMAKMERRRAMAVNRSLEAIVTGKEEFFLLLKREEFIYI